MRPEIAAKRHEAMVEAQMKANRWNLEHDKEVRPLGFQPAPAGYQGFNRQQRRNGVAKAYIEAKMAKNREIAEAAKRDESNM